MESQEENLSEYEGEDEEEVHEPPVKKQRTGLEEKMNNFQNEPVQKEIVHSRTRRTLIKQIKYWVNSKPGVSIDKTTILDQQLNHYDDDELRMILDNVKDQCGGLSPYAFSKGIIKMAGTALERGLKRKRLAEVLSNDTDLVAAVDELIPISFGDFGAPIQIFASLLSAFSATGSEPRFDDGDYFTPGKNTDNRKVPNGQNDFRSEVDTSRVRSTGGPDHDHVS